MYRKSLPLFACLLAGCASMSSHTASSLSAYLYPRGQQQPLAEHRATLHLPADVGIAFVPATTYNGLGPEAELAATPLSQADEDRLLNAVARHFSRYRYIGHVEVIPDEYLVPGGGYENLDALANLFGLDVIALVSYDQVQRTTEGPLSIFYLTIVGAYAFPLEHNQTATFVDTAVFDAGTHKLLFRAPGISRIKHDSTYVGNVGHLRDNSREGFERAFPQMIANLDRALARFREKVKNSPDEYKVAYRGNYHGGGGAVGVLALAGLLLALLGRRCRYVFNRYPVRKIQ